MNAPAHPSKASADPPRADAACAAAGLLGFLREAPMVVAGLLLFVGFAATSSVFPTAANAENILRQAAPTLILGIAMALVVLIGGIDLSVGSVVIASYSTCSSMAAPTRRRRFAGIRCVDANRAAPPILIGRRLNIG